MLGDYMGFMWPGMVPSGPMTRMGPATPGINPAAPDPNAMIGQREPIEPQAGLGDGDRRTAMRRLALMLGVNLLDAAPTGDFAGGMARGVASASQDRDLFLERRRERERQEAEDRRREEAHGESLATSRQSREFAGEDQEFARQQRERMVGVVWKQEDEDRTGKREAAERLVDEIKEVTGEESYEANRAEALYLAGPESINDLRTLHEQAVGRARFDEDADRKTAADIRAAKSRVEAGVEEDPLAAGRRAERQVAAYEKSATGGGRETGSLTQNNLFDEVSAETKRLYETLLAAETSPYGNQLVGSDGQPLSREEQAKRRMEILDQAAALAEQRVLARTQRLFGAGGGGAKLSDAEIVEQVSRMPGIEQMAPDELRQRLLRTVGGDAERAERLLVMLAGM